MDAIRRPPKNGARCFSMRRQFVERPAFVHFVFGDHVGCGILETESIDLCGDWDGIGDCVCLPKSRNEDRSISKPPTRV
jgi:hypothetical protein